MSTFHLAQPPLGTQEAPMLRPMLWSVAAISLFELLPSNWQKIHWGYSAALLLLLLLGNGVSLLRKRRTPVGIGYGSVAYFVLMMGLLQYLHQSRIPEAAFAEQTQSYRAYLTRSPARNKHGAGYILHLRANLRYTKAEGLLSVDEHVRLRYHGSYMPFEIGDELWVRGAPQQILASTIPSTSYNYAKSQWRKGIHFKDHATRKDLIATGRVEGNWLWIKAQRFRKYMQKGLHDYLPRAEAQLAEGLLLGEKQALSDQLQSAFFATGSMHVLAVSGLHVGILYGVWMFCASLLPLGRYAKGCRLICVVLLLWGFAFVVGLSHSVVRATTLGTLLVGNDWIGRRTNPYNSLSLAAICILWADPWALFSLSFQLSFLGVLGILLFYRPLYAWLSFRHALPKAIWAMLCVSVAAQIATFPLVVYHFKQLSLVFPLSSVLLTVLLFLILPLSLGVALSAAWEGLASIWALLLEPLLRAMIGLTTEIASWPFSHLYPLHLKDVELWLWYGALLAGICFLIQKRPVFVVICSALLLTEGVMGWLSFERSYHAQQLWIRVDRNNNLLLQHIKQGSLHQTQGTDKDRSAQDFLQQHGYAHAISAYPVLRQPLLPVVKGVLYATQAAGRKILWLKAPAHQLEERAAELAFRSDYLVLSNQSKKDVESLRSRFLCQVLILSPTAQRVKAALSGISLSSPHLLSQAGPFYQNLRHLPHEK